jgi:hypothetical protein
VKCGREKLSLLLLLLLLLHSGLFGCKAIGEICNGSAALEIMVYEI